MNSELLLKENEALRAALAQQEKAFQEQLNLRDQRIRILEFERRRLLEQIYARKRERFTGTPQPLLPFEEANEETPIPDPPHALEAPDEESTEEITYTRRKPVRMERLPASLPRRTTELNPPAEEMICKECHGSIHLLQGWMRGKPAEWWKSKPILNRQGEGQREKIQSVRPEKGRGFS